MSAKLDEAIQTNTASTIVLDVIDRAQFKLRQAMLLPDDNPLRETLVREVQTLRDEAQMLSERFNLAKK